MYNADSAEPDLAAALGPLSNFSTDELKDLLNNDERFEEIIKTNQQVISMMLLLNDVCKATFGSIVYLNNFFASSVVGVGVRKGRNNGAKPIVG